MRGLPSTRTAAYDRPMRAARFHGREDIRLEEVPEPDPGAGEVKLRALHAGICGTPAGGWIETIGFDDIVAGGFEPLNRQEQVKVLIDVAGTIAGGKE
jgi:NADPH:quinone reductase-like Zn-dependent oxidoreductase